MTRICIVDDHDIVRRGFVSLIRNEFGLEVVADFGDGESFLRYLHDEKACDILILDISLEGISGLELLKQALSLKTDLRVLVLSMHPEERYGMQMLRAGAFGYLNKSDASENIVKALRRLEEGKKYISENMAEQIAERIAEPLHQKPHEKLSDREYQIMLMLANGKSSKEIASVLNLAQTTVHTYKSRLYDKMGFSKVNDIFRYAIENNLID